MEYFILFAVVTLVTLAAMSSLWGDAKNVLEDAIRPAAEKMSNDPNG